MTWSAIGQSMAGTSHTAIDKPCEDALQYTEAGDGVLLCLASDGAGSALYGGWAANYCTSKMLLRLSALVADNAEITAAAVFEIAEDIYDALTEEAAAMEMELNEFSCTLLGCVIGMDKSLFFQIGDGAIVRNVGGYYTPVWWPENGEYQNSTTFVVDDPGLGNLKITVMDERVDEVAIFTDGLQLLALNTETETVHQPFFNDLFRYLRMAVDPEKVNILNDKLKGYLDGPAINARTDDDKTLFMATRVKK